MLYRYAPESSFNWVDLGSRFGGCRVAVDASIYMYQALYSQQHRHHVAGIYRISSHLLSRGITPCFVFDSVRANKNKKCKFLAYVVPYDDYPDEAIKRAKRREIQQQQLLSIRERTNRLAEICYMTSAKLDLNAVKTILQNWRPIPETEEDIAEIHAKEILKDILLQKTVVSVPSFQLDACRRMNKPCRYTSRPKGPTLYLS